MQQRQGPADLKRPVPLVFTGIMELHAGIELWYARVRENGLMLVTTFSLWEFVIKTQWGLRKRKERKNPDDFIKQKIMGGKKTWRFLVLNSYVLTTNLLTRGPLILKGRSWQICSHRWARMFVNVTVKQRAFYVILAMFYRGLSVMTGQSEHEVGPSLFASIHCGNFYFK